MEDIDLKFIPVILKHLLDPLSMFVGLWLALLGLIHRKNAM